MNDAIRFFRARVTSTTAPTSLLQGSVRREADLRARVTAAATSTERALVPTDGHRPDEVNVLGDPEGWLRRPLLRHDGLGQRFRAQEPTHDGAGRRGHPRASDDGG